MDEEREKIRAETSKKIAEENRLKDLEKDKVINDLNASLADIIGGQIPVIPALELDGETTNQLPDGSGTASSLDVE